MKYLLIILFLTSCASINRAYKTLDKNKKEAAEYCVTRFPVIPDTTTIPGKPIIKSDTTYLPSDSVPCPPNQSDTTYIPCPSPKVIHDSVFVHDTTIITKNDPAKDTIIKEQKKELRNKQTKLSEYKSKASTRGWIIIGIIAFTIILLFLKIK